MFPQMILMHRQVIDCSGICCFPTAICGNLVKYPCFCLFVLLLLSGVETKIFNFHIVSVIFIFVSRPRSQFQYLGKYIVLQILDDSICPKVQATTCNSSCKRKLKTHELLKCLQDWRNFYYFITQCTTSMQLLLCFSQQPARWACRGYWRSNLIYRFLLMFFFRG